MLTLAICWKALFYVLGFVVCVGLIFLYCVLLTNFLFSSSKIKRIIGNCMIGLIVIIGLLMAVAILFAMYYAIATTSS